VGVLQYKQRQTNADDGQKEGEGVSFGRI
jgi:hypothetical protein